MVAMIANNETRWNGKTFRVGTLYIGGVEVTATAAELAYLDITTLGTGAASKAVVLNASGDYTYPATATIVYPSSATLTLQSGSTFDVAGTFNIGAVAMTATAAELNYLDIASLGTGAVSKAVVLSATGTYTGPTSAATKFTWSVTSDSTDAGTSVEPFVHNTTMTGIGGVGGRARFELDTNVALGSWANALKAQTEFGASGRVTGLGSSFVAEMTLSAGTSSGTYAPIEIELNMGASGSCGTATSLIYASVNDAAATTFDTSGYLLNLAGVTAGTSKMFMNVGTATALADFVKGLRIKVAGTDYVIPLITAAEFAS